jgi:D-alanyl-D-alanine carboxypeptidase
MLIAEWRRIRGHVRRRRNTLEWMGLGSTKTGKPIVDVSSDDPCGLSLGLSKAILGPIGAQRFYLGESLGHRTLYVRFQKRESDDRHPSN